MRCNLFPVPGTTIHPPCPDFKEESKEAEWFKEESWSETCSSSNPSECKSMADDGTSECEWFNYERKLKDEKTDCIN